MVHPRPPDPAFARLRTDLTLARATLRAAAGSPDDPLAVAAARLDRALATVCPHDPEHWYTDLDPGTHSLRTACRDCGVSWYADYGTHLWHRSDPADLTPVARAEVLSVSEAMG